MVESVFRTKIALSSGAVSMLSIHSGTVPTRHHSSTMFCVTFAVSSLDSNLEMNIFESEYLWPKSKYTNMYRLNLSDFMQLIVTDYSLVRNDGFSSRIEYLHHRITVWSTKVGNNRIELEFLNLSLISKDGFYRWK